MTNTFFLGRANDGAHAFKAPNVAIPSFAITPKDKKILRELAKQYAELVAKDVNRERIQRIRAMHSLNPVRPPVWIDEIPWHEMDIDRQLQLRCESNEAQILEQFFRRILFRWKYFQVDMVVEDAVYLMKTYTHSGIGIEIKEEVLSTDMENAIVSHNYEDQLDTEDKVDNLKIPVIQAQPEMDRKNLEFLSEIVDDIIPVRLRGHGMYYTPWDAMSEFRNVTNCLEDLSERPELIHKTIKKLNEIGMSVYTQMEEQGLLDYNMQSLHCTPPYTDDLPAKDYDGGKIRLKDVWFRGHAQMLVMVSPAMRDEFDLQYLRPLMEKCGLAYYGCCEPLDKFIPYLKKVPNMRKIGASPWADIRSTAEQVGGAYVVAKKPNPANMVEFNPDIIRKEISETVKVCLENKCPYEFVLKDISTVERKPMNLSKWAETVTQVIDGYYR
jgi:hypothetical protein